jgi:hypothetical protein
MPCSFLNLPHDSIFKHVIGMDDIGPLIITCHDIANSVMEMKGVLEPLKPSNILMNKIKGETSIFKPSNRTYGSPHVRLEGEGPETTQVFILQEYTTIWSAPGLQNLQAIVGLQNLERTVSSLIVTGSNLTHVALEIGGQRMLTLDRLDWDLIAGAESSLDLMTFMDGLVLSAYHNVRVTCRMEPSEYPATCTLKSRALRTLPPNEPELYFGDFDIRQLVGCVQISPPVSLGSDAIRSDMLIDDALEPHVILLSLQLQGIYRPDLLVEITMHFTIGGVRSDYLRLDASDMSIMRAGRQDRMSSIAGIHLVESIRDCHIIPICQRVNITSGGGRCTLHMSIVHTAIQGAPGSLNLCCISSNTMRQVSGMTGLRYEARRSMVHV